MKLPFTESLTKEEINALPLLRYRGPIHIVRDPGEVEPALERLSRESILGFDTETRPAFKKGESYPPSLVQLAGADAAWLFPLGRIGFPPGLRALLAHADSLKVGVAMAADCTGLRGLADFEPAGFLDLAPVTTRIGIQHNGLRGLTAAVLGGRISKGAQRSNWSRDPLSEAQIRYAATDAWVAREIYVALAGHGLVDSAT